MQGNPPTSVGDGLPNSPRRRPQAFDEAARHSARVKILRRAIIFTAILAPSFLLAVSWFRRSELPGAHLQLDRLGLSGDKVTMENPKLTGVRRDGRPFEVTARSGVQNPHEPTRMQLTALDAKIRFTDGEETRILGDQGVYDSNSQVLALSGNVRIKSGTYDLAMKQAEMNFKSNAMKSNEPVILTFRDGWISANALTMSENGSQLSFLGNVQSLFRQGGEDSDAAPQKN